MREAFENVSALVRMMEQNLERLKFKLDSNPEMLLWADEDRAEFRRLRVQLTKQMKKFEDKLYNNEG